MKTLFIILSLVQMPFLVCYSDYYGRFIGNVDWIRYGHHLLVLYVLIAFSLGVIGSRISFRLFFIVGITAIISQTVLMWFLTNPENDWWFPFGSVKTVMIAAIFYFLIQWVIRFLWTHK